MRSKDSISGKRSSRVDLTPSLPSLFGSVSLAALISCRCPTDGANPGAGNPSFGDAPNDSGGTYTCRSHPRSPSEPSGGLFIAPAPGEIWAALAQGAGGRRFGVILGLGGCAVFARIGLTGVKPATICCSRFSNSIRARRTSDICLRKPSHASVETTTREWARHGWVRERTRLIRQRGGCRSGPRNPS